jgi:hypothetical protein
LVAARALQGFAQPFKRKGACVVEMESFSHAPQSTFSSQMVVTHFGDAYTKSCMRTHTTYSQVM